MLPAVIKNPLELRPNEELVEDRAEGPERRHVGDEVVHFRPAPGQFAKGMFVMPHLVGADPLLVDKAMRCLDVHDFGQPGERNSEHGRDGVFDHQARINFRRQLALDHEIHRGRRDLLQVARIGKKAPAIRQRHRHVLASLKLVNGHGDDNTLTPHP